MNRSAFTGFLLLWSGPLFAQTTQPEPTAASTQFPTSLFAVIVSTYILLACVLVGIMIWKISTSGNTRAEQEVGGKRGG